MADMSVNTAGKTDLMEWACCSRVLNGQQESGDRCVVKSLGNLALLAVIDGIGHGEAAALASKLAADTLQDHAHESVIALTNRVHGSLKNSRGVVMTLATLNSLDHTLTWIGVGNVEGVLLRRDPNMKSQESVLLRGGVVGSQLPPLRAEVIPVMAGDLIIFATDGIYSGYTTGINLADSPNRIAEHILAFHGKGTDDALVLVVRYLGGLGSCEAETTS